MLQVEAAGSGRHGRQERNITFLVEGFHYAIEMKYVRELLCSAIVTCIKFDNEEKYCPVINFRGKLVRVFDLEILLGRKSYYAPSIPNVLMIEQKAGGGKMAGLIVDSLGEVIQGGGKRRMKSSVVSGSGGDKLIKAEIRKDGTTIRVLDMEYFFENEFVNRGSG